MISCKQASDYSDEEHIMNVSKIIETKYIKNGVTYKMRPLYDNNEKLSFFAIDFSNETYFYIKIQDQDYSTFWGHSLYTKDTTNSNSGPWQKSKYVEEDGKEVEEFEKDELGNAIYYYNSHFEVQDVELNTKCYLIEKPNSENTLIPAIKTGDKYFNLITMDEFEIYDSVKCPNSGISFIPKNSFNL